MFPKVVQVIPMKDYTVYIYFEDGKIVCYDMSKMIEKEAFYLLKDIDIFMDTCTVLDDTLAWDIHRNRDNTACLDIDPETLYELPFVSEQIAYGLRKTDCGRFGLHSASQLERGY